MRKALALLVLLTGCPESKSAPPTPEPSIPAQPPIHVRVDEVGQEYQRNPVAADMKYGGRRLEFDGLVAGMEKVGQGVRIGLLLGGVCTMRPGQDADLAELVVMESKVRLVGSVARMGRTLELRDCELIEHVNPFAKK